MSSPRRFSSFARGLTNSTATEHRYPYDKPADMTGSRGGPASTSSQPPRPVRQHRFQPTDIEQTISTLISNLKQNRHMKHIWEVAIKRNGMTTSLALLGSVLFADALLYPGSKKAKAQHGVMQTNLAPHGTSAAAPTATDSSTSTSSSSSPVQHSRSVPSGLSSSRACA